MTKKFKILTLDGGGSKGIYSLGALNEVEKYLGSPLSNHFDLIYGTSTGAIIAAGLAMGKTVEELHSFYIENIPRIMKKFTSGGRSKALAESLKMVFGEKSFNDTLTNLGIVSTNFDDKRPFIFKTSVDLTHGMQHSFEKGFGVSIADAVQASSSAYPFFKIKKIEPTNMNSVNLVDGGFSANNPSLFALVDAFQSLKIEKQNIRLLSVGVGNYPECYPIYTYLQGIRLKPALKLISTQFSTSSSSIESVFEILAKDIQAVRINGTFSEPNLKTSLFEHDPQKLSLLKNKGRTSFGAKEQEIQKLFTE